MPDLNDYDDTNRNSRVKANKRSWWFDRARSLWFLISYLCTGVSVGIWGRPRIFWAMIAAFAVAGAHNFFSIFTIYYSARKVDNIRCENDIYGKECKSWAKIYAALVSSLFLMQIVGIFLEDNKTKDIADAYALIAIGLSHQLFARENRLRAKGQTCSSVRLQRRLRNRHNFFTPQERYQVSVREIYDSQRAAYGYLDKALELLQLSKDIITRLQAEAPEDFIALCRNRLNDILQKIDNERANLQQISSNIHTAITETRGQEGFSDLSEDIIYMVDSQENTNSGDSGGSDSSVSNISSIINTEHSINSEERSYLCVPELLLAAISSVYSARAKIEDAMNSQISKADIERLNQSAMVLYDLDDALGVLRTDAKEWTVDRLAR